MDPDLTNGLGTLLMLLIIMGITKATELWNKNFEIRRRKR